MIATRDSNPADPAPRGPSVPPAGSSEVSGEAASVGGLVPPRLLQPGERVELACKPSLWFIVLHRPALLALACAAWIVPLWVDPTFQAAFTALLVAVGVSLTLLRLVVGFLDWLGRIYAMTDRRVFRIRGILRVRVFEAPLHQIQHTGLSLPLIERLLGLGTITFNTSGTGGTEAAWETVADPVGKQRAVTQARGLRG